MDRVFLDANVLFSAAYRDAAGLLRLWTLSSAKLLSSDYAVAEARRNLTDKVQQDRLTALLTTVEMVPEPPVDQTLPKGVSLADKDIPIVLAAIQGQATHLLTGDIRHFGALFNQVVFNTLIQRPADYLAQHGSSE